MSMENYRLLQKMAFWRKLFVISWWGFVVGTYVWFLGLVGKAPIFDGWLSIVAATLIGGAGMNHITNLYKTPMDKFSLDYVWPVILVSLGAVLMIIGVLVGALHTEFWAQIASIIYVFISVIAIVVGSDTAPKEKIA